MLFANLLHGGGHTLVREKGELFEPRSIRQDTIYKRDKKEQRPKPEKRPENERKRSFKHYEQRECRAGGDD